MTFHQVADKEVQLITFLVDCRLDLVEEEASLSLLRKHQRYSRQNTDKFHLEFKITKFKSYII